ncbi:hypothetical protein P3T23_009481 [Paraburkholderia sp. GAS448]|uniref:hypothetical protein n=1 Tax=Paraburkholderia sp. GAS448 TaxID=3035136 RepID=UPI003D21D354
MKITQSDAIEEGMRERFFLFGPPLAPHQRQLAAVENDFLRKFDLIYQLAQKIRSRSGLRLNTQCSHSASRCAIPVSNEKNMIRALLEFDTRLFSRTFNLHSINPVLRALIDCDQETLERRRSWSGNLGSNDFPKKMIDEMNQEFSTQKTTLADRAVRREEANYLHRSNQDQREMSKFLERRFYNEQILCGMRINLGYPNLSANGEPLPSGMRLEEVNHHRIQLFQYLDNDFVPSPVGLVVKLEHSHGMGYGYHCLLLFTARQGADLVAIAEQVGKYWTQVATQGKGVYYRWQSEGAGKMIPGVGRILCADELVPVVRYFFRLDRYMTLAPTRTLFKRPVGQDRKKTTKAPTNTRATVSGEPAGYGGAGTGRRVGRPPGTHRRPSC